MSRRVIVAMSGGVDSSVAAHLLQKEGYEVIGLFMRLGTMPDLSENAVSRTCCSVRDAQDAQRVANTLGIPFYSVNFEHDFDKIIGYFCDEYNRGRTPNPCIVCNDWLKFGHLLEYADKLEAEFVATGHYARIVKVDGRWTIRRGLDSSKDQSYVLFTLRQEQLSRALFPVGELGKAEVRNLAEELGLAVADKPDSQEICFVPDRYGDLLRKRTPDRIVHGSIKDTGGNVLGTHEGIQFYTVGQRRGLKIAVGRPLYVVRLDADENTVVVGSEDELLQESLIAAKVNWMAIEELTDAKRMMAQIRYNHVPALATVQPDEDNRVNVIFDRPERAVAPGQAVVFYEEDMVVGGGWIE